MLLHLAIAVLLECHQHRIGVLPDLSMVRLDRNHSVVLQKAIRATTDLLAGTTVLVFGTGEGVFPRRGGEVM